MIMSSTAAAVIGRVPAVDAAPWCHGSHPDPDRFSRHGGVKMSVFIRVGPDGARRSAGSEIPVLPYRQGDFDVE